MMEASGHLIARIDALLEELQQFEAWLQNPLAAAVASRATPEQLGKMLADGIESDVKNPVPYCEDCGIRVGDAEFLSGLTICRSCLNDLTVASNEHPDREQEGPT